MMTALGASRPAEADALEARESLLYARWIRAVDLLWREALARRAVRLESPRSLRRARNLRRIVRRALSEYHRIQLERRESPGPGTRP